MKQEEKNQEISRLKDEINARLARGNGISDIRDLTLFLKQDQNYLRLYRFDTQLSILLTFLQIWQKEQRNLPDSKTSGTIFYQANSLNALEQKYRAIEYYGLRIENGVPESFCRELLESLLTQKVSGIAIGTILISRTEKPRDNILVVTQELKRRLDFPNAVLLLQSALKEYPHDTELLLEAADCWIQGGQFENAYGLLQKIENPAPEIQEIIDGLQGMVTHGE